MASALQFMTSEKRNENRRPVYRMFTACLSIICLCLLMQPLSPAFPQTLPGPADPGRIEPARPARPPDLRPERTVLPEPGPAPGAPQAAKEIFIRLEQIVLEGVTAFPLSELSPIYQPLLGTDIRLDRVWDIAGQITGQYQSKGYFLSRAYVPAQEIEDGIVTIKVAEGYIAEVALANPLARHPLLQKLIAGLVARRPVTAWDLESFMLELNALPGKDFRGFIAPLDDARAGEVALTLHPVEEPARGDIRFHNAGSRYFGPTQATGVVTGSLFPLQETTLLVQASIPPEHLKYGALEQRIPVLPGWELNFWGSLVKSNPGASLEDFNIKGRSVDLGAGVRWQPIRLRQKNLAVSLWLMGKNSDSDIYGDQPFLKDRVRVLQLSTDFDAADFLNGYNNIRFAIRQGVDILGASQKGDPDLSRAEARPDFTSLHLDYSRWQQLPGQMMALVRFSGQLASGPLFSSEEFGYGGQEFGRGYDPSDILGDHGISGALELSYRGTPPWQGIALWPYAYYDAGKVWNDDTGGIDEFAASTGFGLRFSHRSGISGQLGLAWRLTRNLSTSIYQDSNGPRMLLELGYGF